MGDFICLMLTIVEPNFSILNGVNVGILPPWSIEGKSAEVYDVSCYGNRCAPINLLTDTQREGAVPWPPLPPQTGEHLRALQCVSRVTAKQHCAPCKMTPVLPLVAKLGNAGVLALHQLKTWKREWKRKPWIGMGGGGGGGQDKDSKLLPVM